jgi:hypothetical protein
MNGGRLFRRPKLTLSCGAEGKEGRKESTVIHNLQIEKICSFPLSQSLHTKD